MANDFYKGARRQERIGAPINAVQGPNMSEAAEGNRRRTASILSGLDGIMAIGKGAVSIGTAYADKKTKEASLQGAAAAKTGAPRPEEEDFWSGDAAQKAYDDISGEIAVRDLPAYVERHMANNPDIKKPFDELTPEERSSYMLKARDAYFKEKGLEDKPFKSQAELYAAEILSKQGQLFDREATKMREQKAMNNVATLVQNSTDAFGGDPAAIDKTIAADWDSKRYQQSLGDPTGAKTKQAMLTGLFSSVLTDSPNLKSLNYLKSPEAKARFGDVEGFDKALAQADKWSTRAQVSAVAKQKVLMENDFYGILNTDGFTSKEEVQAKLDEFPTEVIDEGQKFSLMAKAMKHIKRMQGADALQGAIAQRNFGVVNSAKQEELETAFSRNVMSKNSDIDALLTSEVKPDTPEEYTQNAFTKWVMDGYNLPSYVKEHFNAPINAGNTAVWDKRLATYNKMSQRLGPTGVSKLYNSETAAALDEYASLSADTVMKPEDRKQAIINFMNGAKEDRVTGLSTNSSIRRELLDKEEGVIKELQQFAAEGGGDTTLDFSTPSDLQPFMTMRDNSDTSLDGYAMKTLMGNYSIYRRQNMSEDPKVALRKAKNDFLAQNVWVDWNGKSTYVPREFGENFSTKGMEYVKSTDLLTRIAVTEGIPVEAVEKRVTIQPASDYHQSRKMSVYFDGIEQDEKFTFEQYDKSTSVLDVNRRTRINKQYNDMRNSPEYKAKQERLIKFQKSLDRMGFGFGMN